MKADFDSLGSKKLTGRSVILEPLDWTRHETNLAGCLTGAGTEDLWTFMSIGPFDQTAEFRPAFEPCIAKQDLRTLVITDEMTGQALGMASYMRIRPTHLTAEIGFIVFSPALQRTRAATEAIYLMIDHAVGGMGCRRLEWKCNADNAESKRAAARFGFTFEGVFRQHMIIKGKNRDTAWYSILDSEWSTLKTRFARWLDDGNFTADGQQRRRLVDC